MEVLKESERYCETINDSEQKKKTHRFTLMTLTQDKIINHTDIDDGASHHHVR